MKRVLVSGSRIFDDERLAFKVLDDIHQIDCEYQPLIIVHGGAKGADNIAARWAYDRGMHSEVFKPDWDNLGKAAGILRNIDMLRSGVDLVVAFPRGHARGTKHMIKIAQEAGTEVRVY